MILASKASWDGENEWGDDPGGVLQACSQVRERRDGGHAVGDRLVRTLSEVDEGRHDAVVAVEQMAELGQERRLGIIVRHDEAQGRQGEVHNLGVGVAQVTQHVLNEEGLAEERRQGAILEDPARAA